MRVRGGLLVLLMLMGIAAPGSAQDQIGTLTLDAASYVSFSEDQSAPIPAGSKIRFRFGPAAADGSIPITVLPNDVAIAPIMVSETSAIHYTLDGAADGALRTGASGRQIELVATLIATRAGGGDSAPIAYRLRFTTGSADATNQARTESVAVDGTPPSTSNHVELVGAATNDPEAFPAPGEAVFAVLSGTFDWLPVLP